MAHSRKLYPTNDQDLETGGILVGDEVTITLDVEAVQDLIPAQPRDSDSN